MPAAPGRRIHQGFIPRPTQIPKRDVWQKTTPTKTATAGLGGAGSEPNPLPPAPPGSGRPQHGPASQRRRDFRGRSVVSPVPTAAWSVASGGLELVVWSISGNSVLPGHTRSNRTNRYPFPMLANQMRVSRRRQRFWSEFVTVRAGFGKDGFEAPPAEVKFLGLLPMKMSPSPYSPGPVLKNRAEPAATAGLARLRSRCWAAWASWAEGIELL